MRESKGITMVILVITIIVLLILASISINVGSSIIEKSRLENIKTDMLLIKVKGKEHVENANFKLGASLDSLSQEDKNTRITEAKNELIGEEITNVEIFEGNLNITTETLATDNTNYIYYYKLTTQNLSDMGLKNLISDENNGFYIVKYDIKDVHVEIYNTLGFNNNNSRIYSLNELEQIDLQ